jgi:hypothetical protein
VRDWECILTFDRETSCENVRLKAMEKNVILNDYLKGMDCEDERWTELAQDGA